MGFYFKWSLIFGTSEILGSNLIPENDLFSLQGEYPDITLTQIIASSFFSTISN